MNENGQEKQFVNIDIDNISRWVLGEDINDDIEWQGWITRAPIPDGNVVFTFGIPGKGYASVLSRHIKVTTEARQNLINANMVDVKDSVNGIIALDLYMADRSDMMDGYVTNRTTLVANEYGVRQFLSVPEEISKHKDFDYEMHKMSVSALMVPVVVGMILLDREPDSLSDKKINRSQRRRAEKAGVPVIIQKKFDIDSLKEETIDISRESGVSSAEVIMRWLSE